MLGNLILRSGYDPGAAEDARQRIVRFFDEHLKEPHGSDLRTIIGTFSSMTLRVGSPALRRPGSVPS